MNNLKSKQEKNTKLDEILELHKQYPDKELIIKLKTNDDKKDILIDKL